jgi:hypothetical protein
VRHNSQLPVLLVCGFGRSDRHHGHADLGFAGVKVANGDFPVPFRAPLLEAILPA